VNDEQFDEADDVQSDDLFYVAQGRDLQWRLIDCHVTAATKPSIREMKAYIEGVFVGMMATNPSLTLTCAFYDRGGVLVDTLRSQDAHTT